MVKRRPQHSEETRAPQGTERDKPDPNKIGALPIYQFLLGMVLALYVGFSRLNHLRFVAHDAMLTGILNPEGKATELPGFIELMAPAAAGIAECVVELEGAGRRMRIQMKGMGMAELVGLSRMVWSDKS